MAIRLKLERFGPVNYHPWQNAQSDYRVVQLAYLQLVASYIAAAGRMSRAVGHEVFVEIDSFPDNPGLSRCARFTVSTELSAKERS
jgi:hypothetical protein